MQQLALIDISKFIAGKQNIANCVFCRLFHNLNIIFFGVLVLTGLLSLLKPPKKFLTNIKLCPTAVYVVLSLLPMS